MQRLLLFLTGVGLIATVTYSVGMFFGGRSSFDVSSLSSLGLPQEEGSSISYAALGDSYTVGEGVAARDAWPAQLTQLARQQGVPLKLVATIARSGWTSQDLIERGLADLDTISPEFVTIMIGTNDAEQNISPPQFQTNLRIILDRVTAQVPPEKIVLVTVPSYFVTPTGAQKAVGPNPEREVQDLNSIIHNEAAERGIAVADVFEVSKNLGSNPKLLYRDGLHPSAAGHQEWAQAILPAVLRVLGK